MACHQRIYSDTHEVKEHIHSNSQCYPTLAAPVTLTAGAGAYTLGAFTQIVPASTITNEFDIHSVTVEDSDTNGTYEIWLYEGASDNFIGHVRWARQSNQVKSDRLTLITATGDHLKLPANARIRAKVAHSGGAGTETIDISIEYHTY